MATQSTGKYTLVNADCIRHMVGMEPQSMDLAVFSPPFPQLYAYSSENGDIGNSEGFTGDCKIHLSFFYRAILRIIKPGRVIVVHVAQIPRMKRSGGQGLFDFRGFNIRLAERAGLVWEYDWLIRKNPQSQAIRTKSRELQFAGLESDRAKSRGVLGDYLLKFRTPGGNVIPVDGDGQVSRNNWIDWAECCWRDIRETDTLNVTGTKGDGDTRHICPLQLGVIERIVRLFSNPGETVFSPFAGIGSEGYVALKQGRKFYGVELKPEYCRTALKNLDLACREAELATTGSLFSEDA